MLATWNVYSGRQLYRFVNFLQPLSQAGMKKRTSIHLSILFLREIVWINENMKSNPEQQQAVINILARTAFPAPYVLFGPPGTGKTSTLVEAISQVCLDSTLKRTLFLVIQIHSIPSLVLSLLLLLVIDTQSSFFLSLSFYLFSFPKNSFHYLSFCLCLDPKEESFQSYFNLYTVERSGWRSCFETIEKLNKHLWHTSNV